MNDERAKREGENGRPGSGVERRNYLSYLVRIWRRQGAKEREWLASAESVGSHERHSFGDLPSLYAFIDAQTQPDDSDDDR